MTLVRKIISGGQTGADYGGLLTAQDLGIPTGGWAPKGWHTERGPNPQLGILFGLVQHPSAFYPPRTAANVRDSTATVIFAKELDKGSGLTARLCTNAGKPFIHLKYLDDDDHIDLLSIIQGLTLFDGSFILNVAGNRESRWPGIEENVRRFLVGVLHATAQD
jgi:hypothetical protein